MIVGICNILRQIRRALDREIVDQAGLMGSKDELSSLLNDLRRCVEDWAIAHDGSDGASAVDTTMSTDITLFVFELSALLEHPLVTLTLVEDKSELETWVGSEAEEVPARTLLARFLGEMQALRNGEGGGVSHGRAMALATRTRAAQEHFPESVQRMEETEIPAQVLEELLELEQSGLDHVTDTLSQESLSAPDPRHRPWVIRSLRRLSALAQD